MDKILTPSESRMKQIIEAALFAAGRPLAEKQLISLFIPADPKISLQDTLVALKQSGIYQTLQSQVKTCLHSLQQECKQRGIELQEVASGWRFQVKTKLAPHLASLWAQKTPRYSRALLETLALIAYQQPITRTEIEIVRGVAVSSTIIHKLLSFGWIQTAGHKDCVGRPMLFATSKQFLDDFNLTSLQQLPQLKAFSPVLNAE